MKHNKNNHWVQEMEVGETIYIDFQEIRHTQKGNPYIIAKHEDNTIYANIGRWDEKRFQPGHTYSMTCTKCEYNPKSDHNYLQYKFEEIFHTTSEKNFDPKPVQHSLTDYLETTSVNDDMEYLHSHHVERLHKLEARLVEELEAVRYAILLCDK